MSRVFAYARVSTTGQTTENQIQEIAAAGYSVDPRRVIAETVSGSVATSRRPLFGDLLKRMEEGDVLVVTRLDRLGRDAIDVYSTVMDLANKGIRVHCLALGGVDLTSASGKMTMQILNAMAQFERDLLIERTQSGLRRAKAQGKRLGRPDALAADDRAAVMACLAEGMTIAATARKFATSRQTIMRVRERAST